MDPKHDADAIESSVAAERAEWVRRLADAVASGDVEELAPAMEGVSSYRAATPAGEELLARARRWQGRMRQRLGQAGRLRWMRRMEEKNLPSGADGERGAARRAARRIVAGGGNAHPSP